MRRKKLTEQQVLHLARKLGGFNVHRHKWSQGYLRGICRQLCKQGRLEYDYHTSELVFYKTTKQNNA